MKTLLAIAVTFSLLLAAAGCDTHTLVGREWPPGSGSPDASPPEMSTPAGNEDAASPSFTDVRTSAGRAEDAPLSGDASVSDAVFPPNVDQPFSIPQGVEGQWTGYFQAYQLQSGSDAIALNLIHTAGAPDRITVVLGVGTSPVLTGPDPVWPGEPNPKNNFPDYYEGLAYDAHEVKWRDSRLTFAISANDVFRFWCPMQKSFPVGDGDYSCFPYRSLFQADDQCYSGDIPVSCILARACLNSFCACDANGCQARYEASIRFDVTFDPAPVIGATSLGNTFRITRKSKLVDAGVPPESGS